MTNKFKKFVIHFINKKTKDKKKNKIYVNFIAKQMLKKLYSAVF